jgi:hypothetical protein
VKEHFVHFAGIVKEKLDGRNSLRGIHEVPRSCSDLAEEKEGYSEHSSSVKLRRN